MPKKPAVSTAVDTLNANIDGFVYRRNYGSLLLSSGHRKVNGRWTSNFYENDRFFVHKELEIPGIGALNEGIYVGKPVAWRNSIARAFGSNPGYLSPYDIKLPDPVDPDPNDFTLSLIGDGATGIRLARPGNPVAQLQQFIIELRDLPRLPLKEFERARIFRSLGNEYLNADFGWAAYIKDMQKLFALQKTLQSRLAQLVRDNGLSIKRRRTIRKSDESAILASGLISQPWGPLDDPSTGGSSLLPGIVSIGPFDPRDVHPVGDGALSYIIQERTVVDVWFQGTFRYFVGNIGSSQWTTRATQALFGGDLTPSVLWEVIPWSWLIDWFANVGDLLSNLSTNAVDDEAYSNCNVMRHEYTLREVTCGVVWDRIDNHFNVNLPGGDESLVYSLKTENKMRHAASPFGFGLNWPDFSLRQIVIAAALGFTRGH